MKYKVVGYFERLKDDEGMDAGAKKFELFINNAAAQGWEYVRREEVTFERLNRMNTNTATYQVVIFRK